MRSGRSSTRPPSSFNAPGPSQNARVPCHTERVAEPSGLSCPWRGWPIAGSDGSLRGKRHR